MLRIPHTGEAHGRQTTLTCLGGQKVFLHAMSETSLMCLRRLEPTVWLNLFCSLQKPSPENKAGAANKPPSSPEPEPALRLALRTEVETRGGTQAALTCIGLAYVSERRWWRLRRDGQ